MKTYTKLLSLVLIALVQIPLANAATFPGRDIVNITTFLNDATYFNGYTELKRIDFSGRWGAWSATTKFSQVQQIKH